MEITKETRNGEVGKYLAKCLQGGSNPSFISSEEFMIGKRLYGCEVLKK